MDSLYWIWLAGCLRYDSGSFDRLIRRFSTPRAVFSADRAALVEAIGEKSRTELEALLRHDTADAERIMRYCVATDTGILTYNDPAYPALLRTLQDPPPVLYYLGRRPALNGRLSVAVVGTRQMSEYGKRMTFEIAHDLARAGATVVTGMALGIDGVASAAAVEAGVPTVAVLGSGIDIIYPRAHLTLARAICRRGTVMTEFAPGTPPDGRNFPRRNRIISGLCRGVLVVEGNSRSGALLTARHAEAQGRDIFALPGNADEENSESTSLLLKQGAIPVTCADDILRHYEPVYASQINMYKLLEPTAVDRERVLSRLRVSSRSAFPRYTRYDGTQPPPPAAAKPTTPKKPSTPTEAPVPAPEKEPDGLRLLDENSLAVYRAMPRGRAVTPDELCSMGFTADRVMTAMTLLEIHKCVLSVPGGRYLRS